MDARLAVNRQNWNERVPVHAASDFYGVDRFKAGAISLNDVEREEVGPVAGKSLLHLQCHFGMDTMSWSRLGARATGVDFSNAAIELARGLNAELGLDTRFICSNVYDLPEALDEQFDVVYTASGVLVWLPDLTAWAEVAARFLKPGGTFYLFEGHPLCHIFRRRRRAGRYRAARAQSLLSRSRRDVLRRRRLQLRGGPADTLAELRVAPQHGGDTECPAGCRVAAAVPARIPIQQLSRASRHGALPRRLVAAARAQRLDPADVLLEGNQVSGLSHAFAELVAAHRGQRWRKLRCCPGNGKLAGVMRPHAVRATGNPMNSAREAAVPARRTAPGARTLRGLLERTDTFLHLVELVTSRGLLTDRAGKRVLSLARNLVEHKDIHALSITDNPGGNAMFGADALGTDLISRGQEVVIHLSCKDWNRNALESRGWQLASLGFDNVLALSGDYPVSGYQGQASPVFDTDSVGLLRMFSDMNAAASAPAGAR